MRSKRAREIEGDVTHLDPARVLELPPYRPELERRNEAIESPTTTETGATGESIATRFLEARGYRIVERNFRCKLGELDLVARDCGVLCFIEVRSRGDGGHGHPAETVTRGKQ